MKQPQPEVGAGDPQGLRRKPRKRRANHVDLSVGGRLRQARLLAGASQEEVGNAVGVSYHNVTGPYRHSVALNRFGVTGDVVQAYSS